MKQSDIERQKNLYANEAMRELCISNALSRFDWLGVPNTVSLWNLERILVLDGMATIHIDERSGELQSHRVLLQNIPDDQMEYLDWVAYGDNGYHQRVSSDGVSAPFGVLVWNNNDRLPDIIHINRYMEKLALLDRSIDSQIIFQKNPEIISTTKENKKQLETYWNMSRNGEPVVLTTSALDNTDSKPLMNPRPFTGNELMIMKERIENEYLDLLGVETKPMVSLNVAESMKSDGKTVLRRRSYLTPRRKAASELNSKLGLNISVIWGMDSVSDNINAQTNIPEASRLGLLNNPEGGAAQDNKGMENGTVKRAGMEEVKSDNERSKKL